MRKHSDGAKRFCGYIQNTINEPAHLPLIRQVPRLVARKESVAVLVMSYNLPYFFRETREVKAVVQRADFSDSLCAKRVRFHRIPGVAGLLIESFRDFRNLSAAILMDHRDNAAGKVAEAVRQVSVVPCNQRVARKISILPKNNLAQQIEAQRIIAEHLHDRLGGRDVPFRLAHLLLLEKQPPMRDNLLWQRHSSRHQKRRPINRVETDNLLPHRMNVRR